MTDQDHRDRDMERTAVALVRAATHFAWDDLDFLMLDQCWPTLVRHVVGLAAFILDQFAEEQEVDPDAILDTYVRITLEGDN